MAMQMVHSGKQSDTAFRLRVPTAGKNKLCAEAMEIQ